MLTLVFVCIAVVTVFQLIILVFCWRHRRDALLFFPKEQRRQVLIQLVNISNDLAAIHVFAEAILSQSYGTLNFSQAEFTHQILERTASSKQDMAELLDPSQPLALVAHHEADIVAAHSKEPDSIIAHLEKQQLPHSQTPA